MCTGETSVKYFAQHRGHDCELANLRLTSAQRQTAAGLMAVGMPVSDVLDHMQLSGGSDNVSYLHLATRKDMHNIQRDFNISRGMGCPATTKRPEHCPIYQIPRGGQH